MKTRKTFVDTTKSETKAGASRVTKTHQHEDFVWTWTSNGKGQKVTIWVPYLQKISKLKKAWVIEYNGGSVEVDLKNVDCVMVYGACGMLPVEFLDELCTHKIPLLIHRRNVDAPYLFLPTYSSASVDVLTQQILVREHENRKVYVAKVLLHARLSEMKEMIPIADSTMKKLRACRLLEEARAIEANASARYWKKWFAAAGVESTRRDENALSAALDACSFFMAGVMLRWLTMHRLSPSHGFLHEPTTYSSLVYDLMEPYRAWIETVVLEQWNETGEKNLTNQSIEALKAYMDEIVYVPATRQNVTRKNLLHGVVLSLRSYLLGETKRFVIPMEGEKKGGRPPAVAYRLPGSRKGV